VDRAEDVRRVIRAVSADAGLRELADVGRIGLVGHSLGGYTVLGLAGAWSSWRVDDVKAVLALSPYLTPYLAQVTLSGLRAPVMYQGGNADVSITPAVRMPAGAYEQSPAPKYYVEILGAGHLAWTDVGRSDRALIVRYSLAFMNRYLKGDGDGALLRDKLPGVVTLRYQEK
jgi:predicted dienelactone hydrolase